MSDLNYQLALELAPNPKTISHIGYANSAQQLDLCRRTAEALIASANPSHNFVVNFGQQNHQQLQQQLQIQRLLEQQVLHRHEIMGQLTYDQPSYPQQVHLPSQPRTIGITHNVSVAQEMRVAVAHAESNAMHCYSSEARLHHEYLSLPGTAPLSNVENLETVKMAHFFKTKMCPWYPDRRCRMGGRCNWAHSVSELRPSVDLTNTKLCESLFKRGRCNNPLCRFAHSREDLRATTDVYKTAICVFWERGSCAAGESCRYAHGKHELRPKTPEPMVNLTPEMVNPYIEYINCDPTSHPRILHSHYQSSPANLCAQTAATNTAAPTTGCYSTQQQAAVLQQWNEFMETRKLLHHAEALLKSNHIIHGCTEAKDDFGDGRSLLSSFSSHSIHYSNGRSSSLQDVQNSPRRSTSDDTLHTTLHTDLSPILYHSLSGGETPQTIRAGGRMVSDFNPRPFLSTISRGRVQKWGEDFSTAASSSSLEQRRFSFLNQLRASSDDAVEDLFLGRRHTTDSVDGQPRCILRELLTLPAKSPFPEQTDDTLSSLLTEELAAAINAMPKFRPPALALNATSLGQQALAQRTPPLPENNLSTNNPFDTSFSLRSSRGCPIQNQTEHPLPQIDEQAELASERALE